jgi:hypothetical protein
MLSDRSSLTTLMLARFRRAHGAVSALDRPTGALRCKFYGFTSYGVTMPDSMWSSM